MSFPGLHWKSFSRGGLVALLLALTGCAEEPPAVQCPTNEERPVKSLGLPLFVPVGQEVSFSVTSNPMVRDCPARSVSVEVFDAEQNPVPAQAVLREDGFAARGSFLPTRLGRYRVRVTLLPSGGIWEQDLMAASNPTWDAPQAVLPLPVCKSLDRTTHGTWLCDGTAVRTDGTPPRKLAEFEVRTRVFGNVVWMTGTFPPDWGERSLRRFVDTGTELELTASVSLGNFAPESLWVSEDQRDVLASNCGSFQRYTYDEAQGFRLVSGLALEPGMDFNSFFGFSGLSILPLRERERLWLMYKTTTGPWGPRPRLTFGSRTCPYVLAGEGYTYAGDCRELEGTLGGFEQAAAWMVSRDGPKFLSRYEIVNGDWVELGRLELVPGVQRSAYLDLTRGPGVPAFIWQADDGTRRTVAGTWDPVRREVGLELLPPELGDFNFRVSPRFIWEPAVNPEQEVRVWERPPVP